MPCKLYGRDVFFEDLIIHPMDWDMWSYDTHYQDLKTVNFLFNKEWFLRLNKIIDSYEYTAIKTKAIRNQKNETARTVQEDI